jgi:hypothetical protein
MLDIFHLNPVPLDAGKARLRRNQFDENEVHIFHPSQIKPLYIIFYYNHNNGKFYIWLQVACIISSNTVVSSFVGMDYSCEFWKKRGCCKILKPWGVAPNPMNFLKKVQSKTLI